MEATVGIATFGDRSWARLARERAMPTAREQTGHVIHSHGRDLTHARNSILGLCSTEWLIYLDADDELEPGYIEAMAKGVADLRAPAVRYVRGTKPIRPRVPRVAGHRHDCVAECLRDGNWLVIGTAVRAELLRRVGGWRDFAWSEDWSTWARCYKAGATVEAIPEAIYRAHVREDSRNRGATQAEREAAHRAIYEDTWGNDFASGGLVPKPSMIDLPPGTKVYRP